MGLSPRCGPFLHFLISDARFAKSIYDPVLAAGIAFGFVFIHPFEGGNGRIHRYLIHHVLAKIFK